MGASKLTDTSRPVGLDYVSDFLTALDRSSRCVRGRSHGERKARPLWVEQ